MTLGVAGMVWVAAFGALTVGAFALSGAAVAGVAFAAGAAGGAAVVIWCGTRLLYWPPARLALFRDRLLVIQGQHEMRAVWVQMESVTLTDPHSWPNVRITDSLTIQLKNGGTAGATDVHATLTTSTPGVTVVTNQRLTYPDLPVHSAASNASPFVFEVSSSVPCCITLALRSASRTATSGSASMIGMESGVTMANV